MSIYAEEGKRFDRRPGKIALLIVATSLLLIGLLLGKLLAGATHALASNTRTLALHLPIFAPVAADPLLSELALSLPPARRAIAPAVNLALAGLLIFFWPTGRRLSAVLTPHMLAIGLIVAALASAFDLPPQAWLDEGITAALLWRPAVALLALLLLQQNERRLNEILGNASRIDSPGRRLLLWLCLIPLALLLAGLAGWLAGYSAQAIAAATAGLATLFINLVQQPRESSWQKLEGVEMREAAIAAPTVAALIIATMIWLFGFPPIGESQLLLISKERIERRPRADVSLYTPEEIAEHEAAERRRRSVIDIRWSKQQQPATPAEPAPPAEEPPR